MLDKEQKPKKPSARLTEEEAKEIVEKFKKEKQVLLPEYFSLPGEGKETKREFSKETVLAYWLKKILEEIKLEMENEFLIRNAEGMLKIKIESGQKPGNTLDAWESILGYVSFKQSGLWSKADQEFQKWAEENIENQQLIENAKEKLKIQIKSSQELEKMLEAQEVISFYVSFKQSGLWSKVDQEFQKWAEENIENQQLIENAKEILKSDVKSGLKLGETVSAWNAILDYNYIFQFQKLLEERGSKKDVLKES